MLRRLAAAAALLFALAPAAQAQDADWDKVVAAAKQEGKVVLYSALGGPEQAKIQKDFIAKYGVQVEFFQARGSEVLQRVNAEQAGGKFLGDVIQQSEATEGQQADSGMIVPLGNVPGLANLIPEMKANAHGVPTFLITYALLENTDMVPAAQEPKSWKDLLDPRWKGKILSDDLSALGSGDIFFEATYRAFGREYHDKLAAQDLVFSRTNVEDAQRVARGEYPFYLPMAFSRVIPLKGLPVKLVIPAEGAVYVQFQSSVLKNAPHPNAARLLIDYLLSEEAQLSYANAGEFPVIKDIAGKVAPDMRPYMSAKLLGTSKREEMDAMMKLAGQIYKK